MAFDFKIMRSLIYVDVVKEEYRVKLMDWLYRHHVPDSISKFGPYVTKYAFYNALPTPPEGDRFGVHRMQLTEHYWLVNEHLPEMANSIMREYMPKDVLRWQGNLPDIDTKEMRENTKSGDAGRCSGGNNGCQPFIFAFVPINWEEDFKGAGRTVEDGPNYRWQFLIQYPDSITKEQGEKWFHGELVPKFKKCPYVNRFVSSKIIVDYGASSMNRAVEMWFDGPDEWYKAAVECASSMKKPDWAEQDKFPFLKPNFHIASMFLPDMATSDNLTQYHGYITMR